LIQLDVPIVLAPMAGGPTTPQLAAAVSNAGGLGFLAGGYLTAAALQDQIGRTRALTSGRPLGVNVFVPGVPAPPDLVTQYARTLAAEASRAGVELGQPRFDDDDWTAKLALLTAEPPSVTSFSFGCPDRTVVTTLQQAGSEVWITVTTPAEAEQAAGAGADVLVVQGSEAGSHRASFTNETDHDDSGFGLLSLLQLVGARVSLPLVAAGGISTGAAVAAVLAAGASAAQLGTAFLRCPEAGTAAVHRTAVAGRGDTVMTRAFTGRSARAIGNRFTRDHSQAAPAAYPEVHHLTAPLRAAGRSAGNQDLVNLWAGQTHELGRDLPAADLVSALATEAGAALRAAALRLARA
jgi:nitronate monooxygenase